VAAMPSTLLPNGCIFAIIKPLIITFSATIFGLALGYQGAFSVGMNIIFKQKE
jgi:hypothetical protein